jgi:peptide/nickel transport system permease protein
MPRYLLQRILTSIPLLLGVSIILFGLIRLAPGGPLAAYAFVPDMDVEQLEAIEDNLGLNDPAYIQYFRWLQGIVTGDWGFSYTDGRPVTQVVFEKLPNTLQLTGAALLIAILVGVPAGIFTATRAKKGMRYLADLISMAAVSLPTFWVGLMVILIFAGQLRIIPTGGMSTIGKDFSLADRLWHLAAPALVLSTGRMAEWMRYTHASLVEIMVQDYIRVARSKGLRERLTIYKHAMPNLMVTLATLLGLSLPSLVAGALITEEVFSWPGNGRLLVQSLIARDYPVIMGSLMLIALLVVAGNLLADILYGFLDPRIRYD